MLILNLTKELMKYKQEIHDQLHCDIIHNGFNRDELTVEHIASAWGLFGDEYVWLK